MSLFDGLSDYEAGRCADCRHHRGAANCRGCEYQASTDQYVPPIAGAADLSYLPRLEADPEAYGRRDLDHALESAARYEQCGAEAPPEMRLHDDGRKIAAAVR